MKLTFRNRILLLQLVTVVMTALLIGIGSNLLLHETLEKLQQRQLIHVAQEGAKDLALILRERSHRIEALDMESFHQRYGELPLEKHFLSYFNNLPEDFPVVSLLDNQGEEIVKLVKGQPAANYFNYRYDPIVQRSRRQPNRIHLGTKLQDPQLSGSVVLFAYTYHSYFGEKFLGTLLLAMPLEEFERHLLRIPEDDAISLALVSDQAELLTYKFPEMAFQKLPFNPEPIVKQHQLFGEDLMTVAADLDHGNWRVMASVPRNIYNADINKIRTIAIGVCLFVTLLGMFIAWKLTRLLTRNIDQLVDFADRIGHGDFSHPLALDSSEEFNHLNNAFNRMVIDLDSHQRSLDSLQKIVETVIDPLFVTDHQGMVVQINQATLDLLVCDSAKIINRPLADLFPEAPPILRRSGFALGPLKGRVTNLETTIRSCQGEEVPVLFSSAPCLHRSKDFGVVCILKDVTELVAVRNSREKALILAEESRRKIDVLLRSVPDGLIVTDLQGRTQLMNEPAEMLLGDESEALIQDVAKQLLAETGAQGRSMDIPLTPDKRGGLRVMQAHASVVYDSFDQANGLVMLLRDVSQERSMDQMKNEFISTAAHELRTPLTSILGYSELMLDPLNQGRFSQDEQQDFLQEILSRAETLARIIDELLSISRIESGHPLDLELVSADITSVIVRVVKQFEMTTNHHRYELDLQDRKIYLPMDGDRIQQVLENVLSNAVKYSAEQSVIRISGKKTGRGYRILFEDEGVGMLPEQVEQIYNKFYRGDYSNTKTSGLGIGMSIVKQIIDGHGGCIEIRSKLGSGTSVELTLPLSG